VSFLVLLEVGLRLVPGVVSGRLATVIFNKYSTAAGGMYVFEPITRINFMRPDFDTTAYWSGYFWRHRTDARGFRNPPDRQDADILLLGDSLIYGHGVDEEQTVAHLLHARYGHAVYNLARQGDYLYPQYVLLRLHLAELQPRLVVLFVFLNDFADLEQSRSAAEIADPPELNGIDYHAVRTNLRRLHATNAPLLERLEDASLSRKFLRGVRAEIRLRMAGPAPEAASPHPFAGAVLEDTRFRPLARYYERLLADLQQRCRDEAAQLLLVYLAHSFAEQGFAEQALAAQDKTADFLRQAAGTEGIRFADTRQLFSRCTDCFLAGDGHFSAAGHRRLAEFLHRLFTPPQS
jgi:hypothetical protein